jgi:adenylate cyclase
MQAALAALAVGWVWLAGTPLARQEARWVDQCLRWRSFAGLSRPVDSRLVYLEITEQDLARLPSLDEEYRAAAQLIEDAASLGADLIVFDVLYHRGSPEIAQPILQAIQRHPRVLLAEGLSSAAGSPAREVRVRSFPFLPSRAAPGGLINIHADPDGVYRRYQLLHWTNNGPEPSLALAAYWRLRGVRWPDDVIIEARRRLAWRELSTDGASRMSLAWPRSSAEPVLLDARGGWTASGPAAFGHLTLGELRELAQASQAADRSALDGRVLFVAYVAPGVGDFGATPFGTHEPLVQLHATMLNDLLQRSSHWPAPRWAEALAMASVLLFGAAARACRTKWRLTACWLAGALGSLLVGIGAILATPWVLPSVSVAGLWTVAFVAELARRHSCELVERLKLRTAVGYYFSPRVLERVLATPGSMEPQQVELTVLLTDLRNFTQISERLGARGVFALCNQVFEAQTQAVLAEEGSLEHFLGDQFLCYWGAPDAQPDAADRALRAVRALLAAMEGLRGRLPEQIRELFGFGAAVHAGMAMIGNKGSTLRMDYGVLGDLINAASRVESLTKHYGLPFLMTRDAYDKLASQPACRLIDVVLPVGKSTPIELLEVDHPLASSRFPRLIEEYAAAYHAYQQGRFPEAKQAFADLVDRYGDPASRCLLHRCEALIAAPPARWNGIYAFSTK